MSKKRLIREPLQITVSADIEHVSPSRNLILWMDKGYPIEVHWLRNLDNEELIVRELNLFLRGQRGMRTIANSVLLYLRYVVSLSGSLGSRSLKDFKDSLDRKDDITLNTKYQYYCISARFLKHLMASNVLAHEDIPRGFDTSARVPTASFIDAVRYDLGYWTDSMREDVITASNDLGLREDEAQSLVYGRYCMKVFRSYAEQVIMQHQKDWAVVDDIIHSLNEIDLVSLKSQDFSGSKPKSFDLAVGILYANFGRAIPSSLLWPKGVSDWCKNRAGWKIRRLAGAFFPTVETLDAFLVIALSDQDLMPNVDSVAFYTYLNFCIPANAPGYVTVHLGKKRGSPITKNLETNNITVKALMALAKRIEKYLPEMPGSVDIMQQEFIPIMLHCTSAAGRECKVTNLNPSTTSNMVKRFIELTCETHALLRPLTIMRGKNFRPTHAYLRKLSGESIYQIKHELNHKNVSTTESYVSGIETQAITNRRYQDFQKYLISQSKMENSKRTGSGYICDFRNKSEADCLDFNRCSECSAKRIVLACPEIVAEWIAWATKIFESKAELQFDNPLRWNCFWEPKLVEYQSLIDLTPSRILLNAKEIAKQIKLPCLI